MPALGLLTSTYRGLANYTPQLPLRNLYAVGAVTEPTQFALMSRARLRRVSNTLLSNNGTTAVYRQDGVVSGTRVLIFGDEYEFPSGAGTIGGTLVPSIAGNAIGIVATAGTEVLFDDEDHVRSVAFPDGAEARKVLESQGRFIFLRRGTHRYYWTQPLSNALDGSGDLVIDGLAYASAEAEPDELLDALIYKSLLVLFGYETVEIHAPTGNSNLPWAPIVSSTIDKGILDTGCATLWNDTFAWIGQDYSIYTYNGAGKQKVSTDDIEQDMRVYGVQRLDSFNYQGHEFLRVWLGNDRPDLLLDAQTGVWCEWSTEGGAFRGGSFLEFDDYLVFYDKNEGRQLYLSDTKTFSAGSLETTIEHSFRAGLPIDGGTVPIHNVLLRCQTGLTGDSIEMRFSRDKGATWSNWRSVSLANVRKKVEWRSLGMFDQPGALFEFRTVGATEFSVSGAMFNEFVQGRARG